MHALKVHMYFRILQCLIPFNEYTENLCFYFYLSLQYFIVDNFFENFGAFRSKFEPLDAILLNFMY